MHRSHTAIALLTSALLPFASAEDKPEIRTYFASSTEISALAGKPGDLGTPLPPTSHGEKRYDILKILETAGLEHGPDTFAVYLPDAGRVVVQALPKVLAVADQLLPVFDWYTPRQIEVSVCLWTYETDAPLDPANQPHTLAELRAAAGKSLRLVDSNSLVTASGNRAKHEHRLALPTPPAPPIPPLPPAPSDVKNQPKATPPVASSNFDDTPGSSFETEPNIAVDALSIELWFSYHGRVPRSVGLPDEFIDTTSNAIVSSGATVIVFRSFDSSPTPDGKLTPYVLTLSPQIIDTRGHTKSQWLQDMAENDKLSKLEQQGLAHRALEGLMHE